MKITRLLVLCSLPLFFLAAKFSPAEQTMPVADTPFRQATSVKFQISDKQGPLEFKKVVVDYRNNVYVLTDKGLFRDFPGGVLAKDFSYASLADKIPVDVTIQAETGYLYYLYGNRYLTNARAGTIFGRIPEKTYSAILVNAADDILLLGDGKGTLFHKNEKVADITLPDGRRVNAVAFKNDFYYLTPQILYRLADRQWTKVHEGKDMTSLAVTADKIFLGTTDGYYAVSPRDGKIVQERNNRLPVPAVTHLATVGDSLWFAGENGAFVQEPDRFRYFAGKRWLDQNAVKDMAADSRGNVFLLTDTGLNEVKYVTLTLAQKAAMIQEDLEKYHIRFGWSVAASFVDPSDPTTLTLRDKDNDGLWTSIYLGSQAFRYAVTGEEEARRNVWESFEAFERNLTIHDVEGFSARTFERKGYIAGKPGPWRDAKDEDWVWKGTTSTDEVVGYIFVAGVMDKLVCKTPEERKRVADYIDTILTHVLKHDYYMVDHDGKPTLWARWNKDYVNRFAKTQFDRKLNSTLITAMLELGYKLTGKEIYKSEALRILDEWGYRENMMIPMKNIAYVEGFLHEGVTLGDDWNHSDDEMAFLTYWVLDRYAFNDELKKDYAWIVEDHWKIELPERNALWNVIPYSLVGKIDLDSTVWWLREFNLDRRDYRMVNSHRKDVELMPKDVHTNFRNQGTKQLLTQGEQRMIRHNANGFAVDGGHDGGLKLTGEEFLLPYWMCRYYGVIE